MLASTWPGIVLRSFEAPRDSALDGKDAAISLPVYSVALKAKPFARYEPRPLISGSDSPRV